MTETAEQMFCPLYKCLFSFTPEEMAVMPASAKAKIEEMQNLGDDIYRKFKKLTVEFKKLKQKTMDYEEKIELLSNNLDDIQNSMISYERADYEQRCQSAYSDFWEALDDVSKEFIITAEYLFEQSKSRNADFSPIILEFCRVLENELLVKIFNYFICHEATLSRLLSYREYVFRKVDNAVNDQKNNSSFFLSSMDMIKLLGYMGGRLSDANYYEYALQQHIISKGFDTTKISDRNNFVDPAKDYIVKYRNQAAHPNLFDEGKATNCKDETKRFVGAFLAAKQEDLNSR